MMIGQNHSGRQNNILDLFAAFVCIIFILIPHTTLLSGIYFGLTPHLVLIPIFLWSYYRGQGIMLVWLFLLGFLQDAFTLAPFGFWSLIFCAFFGIVRSQYNLLSQRLLQFELALFAICTGTIYVLIIFVNWEKSSFINMFLSYIILLAIYIPLGQLLRYGFERLRSE